MNLSITGTSVAINVVSGTSWFVPRSPVAAMPFEGAVHWTPPIYTPVCLPGGGGGAGAVRGVGSGDCSQVTPPSQFNTPSFATNTPVTPTLTFTRTPTNTVSFATNTVAPTLTLTPTMTSSPTSAPTFTPLPPLTATAQAANNIANMFLLPIVSPAPARLTECNFALRVTPPAQSIHSRDVNPLDLPPGNYEVIAPFASEVMIFDTDDSAFNDTNSNLENFLVIRILVTSLPIGVKNMISLYYPMIDINRPDSYLYIGMAHLENAIVSPDQNLFAGEIIGVTGDTGLVSQNKHLDISIYYISKVDFEPHPNIIGLVNDVESPQEFHQSYFSLFFSEFYISIELDPLVVWPALVNDTPWDLSYLVSPNTTPPSECVSEPYPTFD